MNFRAKTMLLIRVKFNFPFYFAPVCVHVGSEQIVTNKCDRKIFAVTEKKSWGFESSQQSLTYTLKVRENHSELVDGHDNFTRVKILVRSTHLTTKKIKRISIIFQRHNNTLFENNSKCRVLIFDIFHQFLSY